MSILDFLKRKKENNSIIIGGKALGNKSVLEDTADEEDAEYLLHNLGNADFTMSEELSRRSENEKLISKYGISPKKEGSFI